MPDDNNDRSGNEDASEGTDDRQKETSEVRKSAEDQATYGQGSVQNAAGTAKAPDEEPVGARRPDPRVVRKMSASDFRIKQEPKPTVSEPIQRPVPEKQPEPAPQHEPVRQPAGNEPVTSAARDPPAEAPVQQRREPPIAEPVRAPIVEHPPVAPGNTQMPQQDEPAPTVYRAEPTGNPNKPGPTGANSASGGFMDAIKGVLSFFTILRIDVGEREIGAMNRNFHLAPFAGLVVGLIASLVGFIFVQAGAAAIGVISVFATVFILSKFLHFDGLVDFGDGIIAGGDREHSVKALKDTNIGAGGFGIALIVTLVSIAALSGFWFQVAAVMVIPAMEIFSKNAMVSAAAFGEPGTGMASEQVRATNTQTMLMSTIFSAVFALVAYVIMAVIVSIATRNGYFDVEPLVNGVAIIAASAFVSVLTGWFMANLSNKKFGFVNGDVLGATNEVARVFILVVALLITANYLMAF